MRSNSVPYKRTPVRCTKCEARFTFSRHPDDYVRPRVCHCGNRKFYVDRWMLRRGRQQRCNCSGWWFPHRIGCKGCEKHPNAIDVSYQAWLDTLPPEQRERESRRAA